MLVHGCDCDTHPMPGPQLTFIHLPLQTPEEERKRLLSFVVCGGGPTGVEVAAEMHDMIFDDLKVGGRHTPGHVTVCLGWSELLQPARIVVVWHKGVRNPVSRVPGMVWLPSRRDVCVLVSAVHCCRVAQARQRPSRCAECVLAVLHCVLLPVVPQEHYPELMKDVKIRVIELMDHVLSTYDRKISEYTAERFARAGGRGPGLGTRGWAAWLGGCGVQPCMRLLQPRDQGASRQRTCAWLVHAAW